jgi:hypothetical protein
LSTQLAGGQVAILEVRIEISVDDVVFMLTIVRDRTCWRYNVSSGQASRLVFGRVVAADHEAAIRQVAAMQARVTNRAP